MSAINVDTGLPAEYRQLLKSSQGPLWERGAIEEWARLAQGCPTEGIPVEEGTNTIRFISHHEVPQGRIPTYARIVVADRPNKANPIRVRITVGGIPTVKALINSTVSTDDAEFMGIDIKDLFLNTYMS